MAVTFPEIAQGFEKVSDTAVTLSVTTAVAAGQQIIVGVDFDNTTASTPTATITDARGNTYTAILDTGRNATSNAGIRGVTAVSTLTTGLQVGDLITVTLNAAKTAKTARAWHIAGGTYHSAVSPVAANAATSPAAVTITPGAAGRMAVAILYAEMGSGSTYTPPGSPWTGMALYGSSGGTFSDNVVIGGATAEATGTGSMTASFAVAGTDWLLHAFVLAPTAGAAVPGAPTDLAASPGDQQVALEWAAPASDGGAAITDYVVNYKEASSGSWLTWNPETSIDLDASVTGLTNGTLYDFRVAAINSAGTGAWSSTVQATPAAPSGGGGGAGGNRVTDPGFDVGVAGFEEFTGASLFTLTHVGGRLRMDMGATGGNVSVATNSAGRVSATPGETLTWRVTAYLLGTESRTLRLRAKFYDEFGGPITNPATAVPYWDLETKVASISGPTYYEGSMVVPAGTVTAGTEWFVGSARANQDIEWDDWFIGVPVTVTTHQATASGSATGTGSAAASRTASVAASGAGVGTGQAVATAQLTATASGAAAGSGAAAANRVTNASAAGAGVGSGQATASAVLAASAAAVSTGVGQAAATQLHTVSAAGAAAGSGAAAARATLQASAAGSAVGTGAAAVGRTIAAAASALAAGVGSAVATITHPVSASGAAAGSGSAVASAALAASASGVGVGTGNAEVGIVGLEPLTASASGSASSSGQASAALVLAASASAARTGSGQALAAIVHAVTASASRAGTGAAAARSTLQAAAAGGGVGTGEAVASLFQQVVLHATGSGSGISSGSARAHNVLQVKGAGSAAGAGSAKVTRTAYVKASGKGTGSGRIGQMTTRNVAASGAAFGSGSARAIIRFGLTLAGYAQGVGRAVAVRIGQSTGRRDTPGASTLAAGPAGASALSTTSGTSTLATAKQGRSALSSPHSGTSTLDPVASGRSVLT